MCVRVYGCVCVYGIVYGCVCVYRLIIILQHHCYTTSCTHTLHTYRLCASHPTYWVRRRAKLLPTLHLIKRCDYYYYCCFDDHGDGDGVVFPYTLYPSPTIHAHSSTPHTHILLPSHTHPISSHTHTYTPPSPSPYTHPLPPPITHRMQACLQ